ncbi:hypothetical protein N8368_02790 [Bacteroidia bacterium]|nr:hypothetical protein [Bacteroidia bacterium]MDB9882866.1 hypothetical protein [Bacteroidia bacterium]MDC1395414.1 hypothetical protein [Bacteroidia bacterium]
MIKYLFSFIALMGLGINSFSQDVITPALGLDIEAEIIEVNTIDIKYKRFDNPDGPTLTIPKSDVLIISYADGTKEVLFKQNRVAEKSNESEAINDTIETIAKKNAPAIITLKYGEDIEATVIEVTETEVVYKRVISSNDSILYVPKSDVLLISYSDGTKELMYKQNTVSNEVPKTDGGNVKTKPKSDPTERATLTKAQLRDKGTLDSKNNYSGRRSGAGWTAVTSFVLTPIVGLIPAAACASSTPREKNLNYENTELQKDPDYRKAYVKQARKNKAVKVLAGYLAGSAAWIMVVFRL